jgi:hypothetical protein
MTEYYIYHYQAYIENPEGHVAFDGIIRCPKPVKTIDDYREVKKAVFLLEPEERDVWLPTWYTLENLQIRSLSLLGSWSE